MGLSIVTKRWFITGTDTDVGKTVASYCITASGHRSGYRTAGYKPVASGSQMTADGLRNSDALALQANSSQRLGYSQVNPFTFWKRHHRILPVKVKEGDPFDGVITGFTSTGTLR